MFLTIKLIKLFYLKKTNKCTISWEPVQEPHIFFAAPAPDLHGAAPAPVFFLQAAPIPRGQNMHAPSGSSALQNCIVTFLVFVFCHKQTYFHVLRYLSSLLMEGVVRGPTMLAELVQTGQLAVNFCRGVCIGVFHRTLIIHKLKWKKLSNCNFLFPLPFYLAYLFSLFSSQKVLKSTPPPSLSGGVYGTL